MYGLYRGDNLSNHRVPMGFDVTQRLAGASKNYRELLDKEISQSASNAVVEPILYQN